MAPIELEVQHIPTKQWIKAGEVKPGDPLGSISDNTPQGRFTYFPAKLTILDLLFIVQNWE